MKLTLILGPMKSGKSFDLISFFAPLKYTDIPFGVYQSLRNVRDDGVWSRTGSVLEAKKIARLSDIDTSHAIVGIDEIHMFAPSDVVYVDRFLKDGGEVVIAGLDTDYRGKMFEIVKKLLELGPSKVSYRRAVCEQCRDMSASHTQIFNKRGEPVLSGIPPVSPDDGTLEYKPVCRKCFIYEK